MENTIQRFGINLEDSLLYVEYRKETDNNYYVRKIRLKQELLSSKNLNELMMQLRQNENDLFNDNVEKFKDLLFKLLSSINDYKTEKVLKSGSDEQIEIEKQKMNESFEQNAISTSDPDYVYDKRTSFEIDENEKLENDWDDEDDEIYDESTTPDQEDIQKEQTKALNWAGRVGSKRESWIDPNLG